MATIGNFDALTGENVILEITDAEVKKMNADALVAENQRLAEKAQRESEKSTVLAKIGLTAEEVKLLLS
jgi:hypothetical protein